MRGFVLSVFLFFCHSVMFALLIYFASWLPLIWIYLCTSVLCVLLWKWYSVSVLRFLYTVFCYSAFVFRLMYSAFVFGFMYFAFVFRRGTLCPSWDLYILCSVSLRSSSDLCTLRSSSDWCTLRSSSDLCTLRSSSDVCTLRSSSEEYKSFSHSSVIVWQWTSCWGHWHNSENLLMSINDNFKGSIHGQTMMCLKVLFSLRTLFFKYWIEKICSQPINN